MCCFSRNVRSVAATRIFARGIEKDRQVLVYQMTLATAEDVAMVLPLPVPAGSAEDAVKFVDLSGYPAFFEDLDRGFPRPELRSRGPAKGELTAHAAAPKLAVVAVGSFEASFVPTLADFERLDERFRLPVGTFDVIPAHRFSGFAVFKLKAGEHRIHPMAFTFPSSAPARLYFPTVHIHDGKVHAKAGFDHELYAQSHPARGLDLRRFEETPKTAVDFVKIDKARDLVAGDRHVYRHRIAGEHENSDRWIEAG